MSDHEIEISSGERGGYRVVARSAAGNVGPVSVGFPFDDVGLGREFHAVEFALLRSAATVGWLTSSNERPVREFGRQLFEFVFPPELRAHLTTSRQLSARESVPFRCDCESIHWSWPAYRGSFSLARVGATIFP